MSDKKNYYLGIDGGGSKTAFALIDEFDRLVYYKECGPSALDTVSFGELEQVLKEGTKEIPFPVKAIFAGLGGIVSQEHIEKVKAILKKLPVCDDKTVLDAGNDVINALYGGLGGRDGLILIAGTGSVCFGKRNGKYWRSGGYCYQEGDAGSAYDLGRKALQHLARVLDGRRQKSAFSEALSEKTGCYTYDSLACFIASRTRTEVASLAKVVTESSADPYAERIIENGVNEVLEMIRAVYETLGFEDNTPFTVIGSLGNAPTLYRKLLLEGIKKISENLIYQEKRFEAYMGSALKAKEI